MIVKFIPHDGPIQAYTVNVVVELNSGELYIDYQLIAKFKDDPHGGHYILVNDTHNEQYPVVEIVSA